MNDVALSGAVDFGGTPFSLKGVVYHIGDTLDSGHCVVDVLCMDGGWVRVNDSIDTHPMTGLRRRILLKGAKTWACPPESKSYVFKITHILISLCYYVQSATNGHCSTRCSART